MSSTLNWLMDRSDGLQQSFLLTLIGITLILIFTWLCHFACHRWNPRLRILLWRTTALGLIVVLGLSQNPYRLNLALLPAAAKSAVVHEADHTDSNGKTVPSADVPSPLSRSSLEESELSNTASTKQVTDPSRTNGSTPTPVVLQGVEERNRTAGNASGRNLSLFGYFVAVWVIGVALNSLGWFGGVFRLISLYRRASEVPSEVQEQAIDIAAAIDYSGPIDVRQSNEIQTPFNVGAWRPRVLIPARQCAVTERQELQASLAHEFAHCKGKDLRWNHLLTLLQTLLWFHPLAWKMRVAHADACDELCDAKAAGYLGDDELYGRLLAGLALRVVGHNRPTALAMARRSQVRKRIEAVGRNITSTVLNRWLTGGMITFAAVAVMLIGSVSISRSQAQPPILKPPVVKPVEADGLLSGTGEPGAIVKLYLYPDWNTPPILKDETTSDANGRFSFKEIPQVGEAGQIVVVATKPGFASVIHYISQQSDRSKIQLAMKSKTAALSGTITDANGTPIANAVVSTLPNRYPIPGVHMAITDQNGRYTIADLTPWNAEETKTFDPKKKKIFSVTTCFFRITHADYPTTRGAYTQIPQTVDITLLPPAIVEGQVVDLVSGEPLADVDVHAQGVARSYSFTTKTDADGNYQLRMTNDHYNIWAIAPDRMPLAIKALKVTQGQRLVGMDIRMTRGGFVVGKVIDPATNQPIDGTQTRIHVAHHGPARPMTGAAVAGVKVKADGTYHLHVAPGRNYVYLMSGNSESVYLKVGDGQTVKHDFVIGTKSKNTFSADPDLLLRRKIMKEARREDESQTTLQKSKPEAATLRKNTTVGNLLTELEEMNTGPDRFSDKWANHIRKIVALGPDVVPQLVAELDRTSSDMMQRCLGFMLRAIGDKRAVPGLIRAIPKTLRRPGSDMGLRIDGTDQALLRFMQQHDLNSKNIKSDYGFGRPVREVSGALRSLTDQDFGEEELYNVFLNGNDFPSQKQAKAVLFHRVADRWAQWWLQDGHKLTNDPAYHKVNLSPLPVLASTDSTAADTRLKTDSGTSNWMLESIRHPPSGRVFYDLDTGRAAALPKRWRDKKLSDEQLQEIRDWAAEQGYDMMGDEIEGEKEKAIYVLRPIGLRTWELPESRWKESLKQTSIRSLQKEGRSNKQDLLVSFDAETNKAKPLDPVTFFYITREGTPGILYVGIEVHDTSMKSGVVSTGDNELNPVAFRKGRRFGRSRLVKKF